MNHFLSFKVKCFFWMLFIQSFANGQQSVLSSGGVAVGNTGTVSYSVGQVFFKTCMGAGGSLGANRDSSQSNIVEPGNTEKDFSISEGVQQAYDIEIVMALDETDNIKLVCTVYPNPVRDLLLLKVENYLDNDLSWELYDIDGRMLETESVTSLESEISLSERAVAIYILKVVDAKNQKEIKTFKIVKN